MAYELEDFCRDCRETLARGTTPEALEAVRQSLARLLANGMFVDRTCGPEAKQGLNLLYEDGALGFQVLAHVNEKPRVSPPHNHGESWAVYGQAVGYTDMTEFRRADDGADPGHGKLEVTRRYRLNPGEVGIYASGAIHSIDYPDKSRFIRVTGTNLDKIYRDAFDPSTGAIKRMGPQQAS
jgi:predicted metal-dependent enzyme (double-stranded beta helix superfamily)